MVDPGDRATGPEARASARALAVRPGVAVVDSGQALLHEPDRRLIRLNGATGVAPIAATVLASTVGFLGAFVINGAVPAIGHGLRASVETLQWVHTGYLVTVASLLLIVARLVHGVGGALVVASSPALPNGTLRTSDRARGIGIWAGPGAPWCS
jgi:hypothetical protein